MHSKHNPIIWIVYNLKPVLFLKKNQLFYDSHLFINNLDSKSSKNITKLHKFIYRLDYVFVFGDMKTERSKN